MSLFFEFFGVFGIGVLFFYLVKGGVVFMLIEKKFNFGKVFEFVLG